MQRWHDKSCKQPDIQILDNTTPYCKACGKRPQIAELIAGIGSNKSGLPIPPDKPLGQLDLWWPRSVAYEKSSSTQDADQPNPSPNLDSASHQQTIHDEKSAETPMPAEDSPYTKSLSSDEFRLIWLDSADSLDEPVHLSLQDYKIDECPEYETVSYTWAGEDGDSTPCKPVYIGPFWDVLLQTNNCWEMLRFVRPWYGNRIIWVDAICICQTNIQERNIQVANMSRIYSSCSRVIIYLGPDIAMPLYGRHARRYRLHEFESGKIKPNFPSPQPKQDSREKIQEPPVYDLKALVGRRYFSRIWVIQELVLSQRSVMRVGDVDFWTDPATASHFSNSLPQWNWEDTPAPWMNLTSQGGVIVESIRKLLSITASSRSTDPRDRLFGLLSILTTKLRRTESGTVHRDELQMDEGADIYADYSLPSQHVFIGLFAFILLNTGYTDLLFRASTASSRWASCYPTWAPDWTSRSTWKALYESPVVSTMDLLDQMEGIIQLGVKETNEPSSEWYMPPMEAQTYGIYEFVGPGSSHITNWLPWYRGASINASTGALNLILTNVMPIPHRMRLVGYYNKMGIYAMKMDLAIVYFVSQSRLDKVVMGDGSEELFILTKTNNDLTYLILRKKIGAEGEKVRNLVSACPVVLFQTFAGIAYRIILLKELQYSVYDILKEVNEMLDTQLYVQKGLELTHLEMKGLFPGVETNRDILPLIKVLYAEKVNILQDDDALARAYLSCISPDYSGMVAASKVQLRFCTAWKDVAKNYFVEGGWLKNPTSRFMYRVREPDDSSMGRKFTASSAAAWNPTVVSPGKLKQYTGEEPCHPEKWIDISFETKELRLALRNYTIMDSIIHTMETLSSYTRKTDESLWSILGGGPDQDYMLCGLPRLELTVDDDGTSFADYFKMSGRTYGVTIE